MTPIYILIVWGFSKSIYFCKISKVPNLSFVFAKPIHDGFSQHRISVNIFYHNALPRRDY